MMVLRDDLTCYLDELLYPEHSVSDGSNNGLQVEGREEIRQIVFGVDGSRALFEAAARTGADLVFVHHGISWKDSLKYLTGLNAGRVRVLFQHDMSLYASHLPLDMHPEIGHNACIADRLMLTNREPFCVYGGAEIGWCGDLPQAVSLDELTRLVNVNLETDAQVLDNATGPIKRVGVVSGGAADGIYHCRAKNVDCLLTGEVGHQYVHDARELGVSVIAAGHYRTEVPGVLKVMEKVEATFDVECRFIDLPTGY